jgi:hypothetical protein
LKTIDEKALKSLDCWSADPVNVRIDAGWYRIWPNNLWTNLATLRMGW